MAATRTHQPKPTVPSAPARAPAPPVRMTQPAVTIPPAVRLGGAPLPDATRAPLEASFQADLSSVRVHSDANAMTAVRTMNASALAYGNHIVLSSAAQATDLGLMAHETAHILQQSARPAVQLSSSAPAQNAHEAEARSAATAVQRGETFQVRGQTAGAVAQFNGGGGLIDRARNALADLVRNIPGYMLISFIIGRDIVANRPVERNAVNLVGAIMGLVPGGNAMFENLQRSGALQRAFEWFSAEFARLNITLSYITGLVSRFFDSLSIWDIIPSRLFSRLSDVFGEPVRRLREFATNAVLKVLEFIFEGVMGAGGAQILALLKRARGVFETIIRDPVRFVGNLIQAARGGFEKFKNNIVAHLQAGLIGWLTGSLAGSGITLPTRFDLRGILSLVLQILGLTYQQLRPRFVRLIGEPRVRLLETAFEFLRILVTEGLAGIWQKITEFAGNLVDMVIGGIRQFVMETIVQQAVVRIVSLFNPAGAVIQAILAIYNTIQWFTQRIQQIMALVNAVVDSLDNIASGNLSAAINYVEQTMARALPVIISFLAGLLGLNRIADKVREIIQRIRAVINRALDRAFDFIVTRVRSFAGRGGDQDPQMRLQRGLADGTAAVNRLGGSRIGIAVMRPVLAAIRLRHRLQVLEPVQRGNRWAVRAVVNPEGEQTTNKEAEGGAGAGAGASGAVADGTRERPYLIKWHKPRLASADTIIIMLTPGAVPTPVAATARTRVTIGMTREEAQAKLDTLNIQIPIFQNNLIYLQQLAATYNEQRRAQARAAVTAAETTLQLVRQQVRSGQAARGTVSQQQQALRAARQAYRDVQRAMDQVERELPEAPSILARAQAARISIATQLAAGTETVTHTETIGVDPANLIIIDRILGPRRLSPPRRRSTELRAFLTAAGFVWGNKDADHVTELSLGGRDDYDNLWPITGNIVPNQQVNPETGMEVGVGFTNAGTRGRSINERIFLGKYFIVKGFKV